MKNKITLGLVVGFALVAHAVTLNLTIVLTAREAKALTYATALVNKDRTNATPALPALSQAEYAEKLLRNQLQYFGDLAIAAERDKRAAKYDALSASEQATVDAALK